MSDERYEIYAGGLRDGLVSVEVRVGEDVVARIQEEERGKPIEEIIDSERLDEEELERALAEARESYRDWSNDEARMILELEE